MEAAILELLAELGEGKTICPSDAAKRVGGVTARRDWEGLMQPTREAEAGEDWEDCGDAERQGGGCGEGEGGNSAGIQVNRRLVGQF